MREYPDLHNHTTASDGSDSPTELIRKAAAANVAVVSVTDHDSFEGDAEARAEALRLGIPYVTGVELSVMADIPLASVTKPIELHLLGYRFDSMNRGLVTALRECRDHRVWRAGEIYKKLNDALDDDGETVIKAGEWNTFLSAIEGAVGRPHIAKLLMQMGIVQSIQEAFDRYLIRCDVPKKQLTIEEGSALIRGAGGYAVLAHPSGDAKYSLLRASDILNDHFMIIQAWKDILDGVECAYWDHSVETAICYLEFALRLDMIATVGGDHHGGFRERVGQIGPRLAALGDHWERFNYQRLLEPRS